MKRNRAIIVSITLVSYFFFIFFMNLSGIISNNSSQILKTGIEKKNIPNIFSKINILSLFIGIKPNSGMDPTPTPPLPPELEVEIETD